MPDQQFHDDVVGDTLALVNVALQAFGKNQLSELPDSRPGDAHDCLFYRAMSGIGISAVHGDTMTFDDERKAAYIASLWGTSSSGKKVRSPNVFRKVIGRFDHGSLPQYVTTRPKDF